MARKEPLYRTEADLCAAFITWAKRHDWTAYAETAGWDIVLVRPTGVQIGIQAKLKFNTKVLAQTLPRYLGYRDEGPDYRAILVGDAVEGAGCICDALGLAMFYPHRWNCQNGLPEFTGDAEFVERDRVSFSRFGTAWFDWNPEKRCELPDYIPDVAAGASGPLQLTPWKVGALRLIATLELRGHLLRADFAKHGIAATRWTTYYTPDQAWLLPGAERGQWVRGPALNFDKQHPMVYAQIREEIAAQLAKQAAA